MKKTGIFGKVLLFSFLFVLCFAVISCSSTKTDDTASQIAIQEEVEQIDVPQEEEIQEEIQEEQVEEIETTDALDETVTEADSSENKPVFTKEQQKFYDIKNMDDYLEIGEDLDYKIIINDEEKEVILLFEETNGNEDWANNYRFFAWPLNLDGHIVWTSYGYSKMYGSAKGVPLEQFIQQLEEHPGYKSVIRGWSLGSAMAKIAARHFTIRMPKGTKLDELTTYGDVKCWLNPFYTVKNHCVRIREYVNANDMITTCLPFYRRDVICRVGKRFDFVESRRSNYLHEHYEEFDYSEWE